MTTSSIARDLACEFMVLISAAMKMRVFEKLEKYYSDMHIEFNQNEMIALITLVNFIWTRRKTKLDQFC